MNNYSIKELLSNTWEEIQKNGNGYESSSSERSIFQGEFKELLNFSASVENPLTRVIDSKNFNLGFAIARLFYLLRGANTLNEIAFYSPKSEEYSDDGKHLFGSSYGFKIFEDRKFWQMVQKIKDTRNSKRLYFPIFNENDFLRDSKDIPCVTGLLVQPRESTLNVTLQMRANDAQKLLQYNLFEFSFLQECLCVASGMSLGTFYYNAGTIHLRGEKDIKNNINPWGDAKTLEMLPMQVFSEELLVKLLAIEEKIRTNIPALNEKIYLEFIKGETSNLDTYWKELLVILGDYGYTKYHKENPPILENSDNFKIYSTYLKNKKS